MKKSELYGSVGSVTSMVLLLLFLLLVFMPGTKIPEEEGIMVSFGDAIEGGGPVQEVKPVSKPVETSPPPAATSKPVKQDLMTQDDNSLAIAQEKKREREAREAAERQRIEQARKEAEKRRQEQAAIDKANELMGNMGSNTGSTGTGSTTGNTSQGNPLGSGSSGGNSWSVSGGRSLSGRLVKPNYKSNDEGRVTVNIRVDANGNVISTSIGSNTNISDAATRNAAMAAAKATKFTAGNGEATGSITYNFTLR